MACVNMPVIAPLLASLLFTQHLITLFCKVSELLFMSSTALPQADVSGPIAL